MRAEIVHDDNVTWLQRRDEDLDDVGEEALAIDRAVEQARGREPVVSKRREERQGPPPGMGHAIDNTATAPAPTSERRHVRLRPGLVDEDETRRINRRLTLLPALAMPRDVGPFLLARQHAFFYGSDPRAEAGSRPRRG